LHKSDKNEEWTQQQFNKSKHQTSGMMEQFTFSSDWPVDSWGLSTFFSFSAAQLSQEKFSSFFASLMVFPIQAG
jgi:hypothetical protein